MGSITIKAVAKDAGVSIATVSRVLNGNYNVSPALRERVMASIEKLHYYPNSVARSLKFDSTHTIGLIVSDISNSFFCNISRSVENVIATHGYDLVVCSTDSQQDKELSKLQLLLSKQVDGIVINSSGTNDAYIASISRDIPFVLCGRKVNHPSFVGDFVDSDNAQGSFLLTRHFIQNGHRRIAIVNGQNHISSSIERAEGFRRAMATIGIDINERHPYFISADFNDSFSGYRGTQRLMSLPEPPTAILAMNNELCSGVLRYLHENEIPVPDRVSIGCYGKMRDSDLLYVQPSYVTMDPMVLGKRIGESLLERIARKNEMENRELRDEPRLIVGNGVAAITDPR